MQKQARSIIFSAPSGSGKTTIVHRLMTMGIPMAFSVSATSRKARKGEQNGVDYYFLSVEDFRAKIANEAFIEWEEVYAQQYYGTLKRELERIHSLGKIAVFDVDVVGGCNLKEKLGEQALSIFIRVPDLAVLEQRLRHRNTDDEASIRKRLQKAEEEMTYAQYFDVIIDNIDLERAVQSTYTHIKQFLDGAEDK